MLQPLQHTHLNTAEALVKKVVANMHQNDLDQWDELYPAREHLLNDIENGYAYGFFENGMLAAYVALNELYDAEYHGIPWEAETPFLIVHRLSVSPDFQGKGIGSCCMQAIENFAVSERYKSIRLDTYVHNQMANHLYTKLQYTNRGTVTFRKGLFYCYEKSLG